MSQVFARFDFGCRNCRSRFLGGTCPFIHHWMGKVAQGAILWFFLALQPLAHGSERLLRDDFLDPNLDQTRWGIADWKLGRTQLGLKPEIKQGLARLSFHTLGFIGTEIYSQQFFSRERGLEIKVRARLGKSPAGLVSGIFTYTTDSAGASDEIDIEFLSKRTVVARKSLPMMLSTWRQWDEARTDLSEGSHHWTTHISLREMDPSVWHEYVIRWLPDRTEWFVDQQFVASTTEAQPDQPTRIRFNLWAPSASWGQAYSTFLMPTLNPKADRKYFLDLDWVEVNQL